MPHPRFDFSLNLGHVLTIAAIIGSVFTAYMTVVREVDSHDLRITAIEKQVDAGNSFRHQVLATLTVIREDIATLKERSRRDEQPRFPN